MARKLPWTAPEAPDIMKQQTKHAVPKTVKTEHAQNGQRPTTPERTPQRTRKRATSRSPSSSPIKLPPQRIPHVEPMQPGPNADDQYIMVEDEFESVARQFTVHLHAAEYARLKAKAKTAPPQSLPPLSPSASRSTKLGVERKHLLLRQSTTLSDIGGKRKKSTPSVIEEEEEEDADEPVPDDGVVDPWRGTSLAELMGEGDQPKTSLMGVERLGAATRAARGFGRGETESSPKSGKKKRTIAEIFADEDGWFQDKNTSRGEQTRNDSDRKGKSRETAAVHHPSVLKQSSRAKPVPDEQAATTAASKRERKPYLEDKFKIRRSRIDALDDFDDTQLDVPASPSRPRYSSTASPSTKRKAEAKKDRKSRLDEVPVFLV